MIKWVKNIFFILPFIMHTVFAFDSYSDDERFGFGSLIEQDGGDPGQFFCSAGDGFMESSIVDSDSGNEGFGLDLGVIDELNAQKGGSDHSLLRESDYGDPQNFLAFLGCESAPGDFFVESGGFVSDPSNSISSSFDSSSSEPAKTFKAFIAAVKQLPRIEEEGGVYKCPFLGCEISVKQKYNLVLHLRFHNASFAVCIFCKKELYTQDMTDSHHCKCSFCDVKCRKRGNVIKFMIEHVRERHPHLLVPLIGGSIPEECVPDSSSSSSSSFDSSSSEPAKTIEAFIAAVKQLPRIEKKGEGAYKCPISGCGKLAKKKDHLELHLKCHNSGLPCIFCKKELYSQDRANFHCCKCPSCETKCNANVSTIEYMAEHVRERHPHLLAPLIGRSVPEGCLPDSGSSSSSSFDSSSSEPAKTFKAFIAAVKQLPRIEEEGRAYKCPISGCGKLAKKKDNLKKHLRSHNAGLVVCIFCKKALYSQDNADSHRCKCPSCDMKSGRIVYNKATIIERMIDHVRERHPRLAEGLGIVQNYEGLADQDSAGFSSGSSSSSSSSSVSYSSSKHARSSNVHRLRDILPKRQCVPASKP